MIGACRAGQEALAAARRAMPRAMQHGREARGAETAATAAAGRQAHSVQRSTRGTQRRYRAGRCRDMTAVPTRPSIVRRLIGSFCPRMTGMRERCCGRRTAALPVNEAACATVPPPAGAGCAAASTRCAPAAATAVAAVGCGTRGVCPLASDACRSSAAPLRARSCSISLCFSAWAAAASTLGAYRAACVCV